MQRVQRVIRSGIALSALLAFNASVAQDTVKQKPAQIAQTGQQAPITVAQAAPAPRSDGAPVGSGGTVTLPGVGAVSTVGLVVGAAVAVGIAVAIANANHDTSTTTGTR